MSGKRTSAVAPAVTEQNAGEETTEQERLAADLRHLLDLLEADQVEEARRYVKELEQRWPEAERVQHYARVLAPPKVRSRPDIPARSSQRELNWLKENAHKYPGCWLAVYEDRLIAADPDRRVVVARAREILGEESALLFHQPARPDPQ
jgi:hypothetical protein